MATAADLIRGSLRLIGQLAEGETPSNETYADSLEALNQMLDAWSTESIVVWAQQDQTFTWPANTATRTLGATGNFVGTRPISISDATYFTVGDQSYPIVQINQEHYNSIGDKTTTGSYPIWMLASMTVPDVTLTVYPVPAESVSMHIVSMQELDQPATLVTSLVIPPGYLRAFRFNLACELAAEFGKEPPQWVVKTATESKAAIERINAPMDILQFPRTLLGCSGGYDIYSG